jgi:hypothetical protein
MQTDQDDELVRNYLSEVPLPAGRLDLPDLLETGQRRVRRRRVGQLGLAALVAVAVTGAAVSPLLLRSPAHRQPLLVGASPVANVPASASPSAGAAPGAACPITPLAVPAGVSGIKATTVDPTGRYIGGAGSKGQDFVPVLWTDGVGQVLPIQRSSASVDSVNASGVVVGLATGKNNEDDVYRYYDGKVTYLKPPPGNWHVFPTPAINAGGDIVINAEPVNDPQSPDSFAFYWPAGSDTAVKIPLPKGANVFGITDDRVLVGGIYQNGVGTAGYTWDLTGKGTQLATPAGTTTVGYAIRGSWAAGGVWPAEVEGVAASKHDPVGAVWNLSTGELTQLPVNLPLNAVNAHGWVTYGGTLWAAGKTRPLAAPQSADTYVGMNLSDGGLVVGYSQEPRPSTDVAAVTAPVTWQC